jgi:quercetin dioxygenase-like cupin family protein
MNIKLIHTEEKPVSAKKIFSTTEGNVTAIQIKAAGILKEHITNVPALLVCINGNAIFKNENGVTENLSSGDMVNIEPNVKHWVEGIQNTQLLLIK